MKLKLALSLSQVSAQAYTKHEGFEYPVTEGKGFDDNSTKTGPYPGILLLQPKTEITSTPSFSNTLALLSYI